MIAVLASGGQDEPDLWVPAQVAQLLPALEQAERTRSPSNRNQMGLSLGSPRLPMVDTQATAVDASSGRKPSGTDISAPAAGPRLARTFDPNVRGDPVGPGGQWRAPAERQGKRDLVGDHHASAPASAVPGSAPASAQGDVSGAHATAVTANQLRAVIDRLITAGHWKLGEARRHSARSLAGRLAVELVRRPRSDRVLRLPRPARVPGASGRPAKQTTGDRPGPARDLAAAAAHHVLDAEEDVEPMLGDGVEVEQFAGEDRVCLRSEEFIPRGSGAAW